MSVPLFSQVIEGGGMAPLKLKIENQRVFIEQMGLAGEFDLVLVHEDQIPLLISALRECKKALSDGHGAQGEPATVLQDKAHETPVRQSPSEVAS